MEFICAKMLLKKSVTNQSTLGSRIQDTGNYFTSDTNLYSNAFSYHTAVVALPSLVARPTEAEDAKNLRTLGAGAKDRTAGYGPTLCSPIWVSLGLHRG